jgi:hypothetical protein
MKGTPRRRSPPSAAAKARVAELKKGGSPIVHDPEEARGVAFISPAERQAAIARDNRERARKKLVKK